MALPAALPLVAALTVGVLAIDVERADIISTAGAAEGHPDHARVKYDVFISYAHKPHENAEWVSEHIYAPLMRRRTASTAPRVFFDTHSIGPGGVWKREIDQAIEETRLFVPIFTPEYFVSTQCKDEFDFAEQLRSSGKLTMLPISRMPLGDVEPRFKKLQITEASIGAEALAQLLVTEVMNPDELTAHAS